jgi:hypothetical protein
LPDRDQTAEAEDERSVHHQARRVALGSAETLCLVLHHRDQIVGKHLDG